MTISYSSLCQTFGDSNQLQNWNAVIIIKRTSPPSIDAILNYVPLSCPAALPVLPTIYQPKQNQAEGGTAK